MIMKFRTGLIFLFVVLSFVSIFFTACSGGGGGGENSGASDDSASLERSTSTAIRLLHGSIDSTPVDLYVDGELVQTARFAQERFYTRVPPGLRAIELRRTNSTRLVSGFSVELASDTEYTIFLYGEARDADLSVDLLEDISLRPEDGSANFRVFNAYHGVSSISVTTGTFFPDD